MDKDETKDLDAALAELAAQRPAAGDIDPATRALMARADVQRAMRTRRELEEMPDPPAPEPVELAGDAGPLLVQAHAVATYVAPVEVTLPDAPRMPTGPVRIKSEVEARRAKTVRAVRVEAAEEGGAVAGIGESAGAPRVPGRAPVSRAPASRAPVSRALVAEPASTRDPKKRSLAIGAGIVFVAGAFTVLALMKKPEPANGPEASTTVQGRPPNANVSATATSVSSVRGASTIASSASTVEAMGTSVPMTSGVPVVASSAKPAPRGTDDPYADASAPVVKSAPSGSGSATTGAPSASVVPSASEHAAGTGAPASSAASTTSAASASPTASGTGTTTKPTQTLWLNKD